MITGFLEVVNSRGGYRIVVDPDVVPASGQGPHSPLLFFSPSRLEMKDLFNDSPHLIASG